MELHGFLSSCHYSLLNLLWTKRGENYQNNKHRAPAAHNSGTSAVRMERPAPHATHPVQAEWKQQSQSWITRDAALSYLHHWALVLTWVFEVSVERPKGNHAALSKLRTQTYLSHTTKSSQIPPYSFSSNVLSVLKIQQHSPNHLLVHQTIQPVSRFLFTT